MAENTGNPSASTCKPTRKKSFSWKYFNIITIGADKGKAQCNLCNTICANECGSTSGMIRHLKRKHGIDGDLESDSTEPKQMKLEASMKLPLPVDSKRAKAISSKILGFVVDDLKPLDIVNGKGFRALIEYLEPRYSMISRTHLTEKLLHDKYCECKQALLAAIQDGDSHAITTDAWTSCTSEDYITVSLHILHEWNIQNFVIETLPFGDQHTSANLSLHLTNLYSDWSLPEETAVTTDNATNIVKGKEVSSFSCSIKFCINFTTTCIIIKFIPAHYYTCVNNQLLLHLQR